MDYLSKGFPDMSYHGTHAWYQDSGYFNRHFSVMLCGAYANTMENVDEEDEDIFIAYNMHWEDKDFDIPSPRSGKVWKKYIDTGVPAKQSFVKTDLEEKRTISVGARSVVVLISSDENEI
jgi:glycogen operon protein